MSKKIIIVGAGPGGLSAAMILAHKGYDVTVFEKDEKVGGRSQELKVGDFAFDTGPTFLMMKFILDEVFELAGEKSSKYLDFVELDPMYRLEFDTFHIDITNDHKKMREQIQKVFPGEEKGFDEFLKKESKRYERMSPCLQIPYSTWSSMLSKNMRSAFAHLSIGKSVYQVLSQYFNNEYLKLCFSFQTKYLGMSPWDCPGAFLLLPFVEHKYGIFHVQGGLSKISDVMAEVALKKGAKIRKSTPIKEVIVQDKSAKGVLLEDGSKVFADEIILNADFAHAMTNFFSQSDLRKYKRAKVEKKKYSCSTFMVYLGLDKLYDLKHHTIVFAKDYKKNLENIFKKGELSDELSFYVRNSSVTDPHVAPKGKSALYVLVPVANLDADIDWAKQARKIRDKIIHAMKKRLSLSDLDEHIVEERIITPKIWEQSYNVYKGATFNLAHTLDQMLYLRPRNKFEEIKNVWLVGGGTHPGSGLPTIYESARITSNLIMKEDH